MPLYFEQCWAILSTIGVANVLYGLVVISITKYTPVVWIPIIVGVACAIANGLCYYAFYADYPVVNKAIASGFADFFWLVCLPDMHDIKLVMFLVHPLTRSIDTGSRYIILRLCDSGTPFKPA